MKAIATLGAFFIALAHFADFLLGQTGQRQIKDRIVDFYVVASEGDWRELIRAPSGLASKYIDSLLGSRILSRTSIRRMFGYSVLCTVLAFVTQHGIASLDLIRSGDPLQTPLQILILATIMGFPSLIIVILVNFLADVISIRFLRLSLSSLIQAKPRMMFFIIGKCLLVTYLAWSLSAAGVQLSVAVSSNTLLGWSGFFATEWWQMLRIFFDSFLILPRTFGFDLDLMQGYRTSQDYEFLLTIAVLLPLAVFLGFLLLTGIAFFSRGFSARPLLLLLERLEESRAGVLTNIAAALSVTLALAKLLFDRV